MKGTLRSASASKPSPSHVEFDNEKCLRRRLRGFQCTTCFSVCHREAIRINEDGNLAFKNLACSGCGACVAACPNEAFSLRAIDIEQAVTAAKPHGQLVITCDEQPFSTSNSLHCPCIAILSPEILTALFLQNLQMVYINVSNCANCDNRSATAPMRGQLDRLQSVLRGLIPVSIVIVYTPDLLPPASQNNRRLFLADLGRNIFTLIRERYQSSSSEASNHRRNRRTIPHRLATVNKALKPQPDEVQDAIKAVLEPRLQIGQSCAACPRCAGICPTGALSRSKTTESQGQVIYSPERCTGCGLCVTFCEKQAIRLVPGMLSHRNSTLRVYDDSVSLLNGQDCQVESKRE